MADLAVGETIEMKGSGAKPYVIKNCGPGGYSCTCPAWRNQNIDPRIRTCKHIRKLRGDEAEQERIGSTEELPSRKVEEGKAKPDLLLANKWVGENIAGWWMSEKLDGVRAYWDGTRFLSRNGNLFLAPDWFIAGMPDHPLDGELWIARKKFTLAQGTAMSQTRSEDWRQMRYLLFDAPQHGGEFEARFEYLQEMVKRVKLPFVELLEQTKCRDSDHLAAKLVEVESQGGEGLMLRQPGSLYVPNRSNTLLKVKTFQDAEAVVIGHQAGEGRHKGRVGALIARLAGGVEFRIGTGLKDAERDNPPPIGSIVNFKYQELTDLNVPRFPVYVGLRSEVGTPAPLIKAPAVSTEPKVAVVVPAEVPAAAPSEPPRRFEYGTGSGRRFWEVSRAGTTVTVRFGVQGGAVQSKPQTYPSEAAALEAIEEMVTEKYDDGFTELVAPGQMVPPPPPPREEEVKPAEVAEEKPAPAAKPAKAPKAPRAAPAAAPAGPAPVGKRRFTFEEGTSSKFWEIELNGSSFTVTWGRIGTSGQTKTKDWSDEAEARKEYDKLVREKTGKGYAEET